MHALRVESARPKTKSFSGSADMETVKLSNHFSIFTSDVESDSAGEDYEIPKLGEKCNFTSWKNIKPRQNLSRNTGTKNVCKSGRKFTVNSGNLNCFYANARSLINKIDNLELYVVEEKPDIIGITETWALETIGDGELSLEGYTMFRKDRIIGEKLRGGGVLLYVKNYINVLLRDDIADVNFPENIFCDIEIGGEKTLVGVCYRPPNSTKMQDEALYKLLGLVSKEKLLVMGDFNFPELNWQKPESLDDSHCFLKCLNDNFLIQCVDETTRGNNILDLVLVSEENMVLRGTMIQ